MSSIEERVDRQFVGCVVWSLLIMGYGIVAIVAALDNASAGSQFLFYLLGAIGTVCVGLGSFLMTPALVRKIATSRPAGPGAYYATYLPLTREERRGGCAGAVLVVLGLALAFTGASHGWVPLGFGNGAPGGRSNGGQGTTSVRVWICIPPEDRFYHMRECPSLHGEVHDYDVDALKEQGYTACPRCFPNKRSRFPANGNSVEGFQTQHRDGFSGSESIHVSRRDHIAGRLLVGAGNRGGEEQTDMSDLRRTGGKTNN